MLIVYHCCISEEPLLVCACWVSGRQDSLSACKDVAGKTRSLPVWHEPDRTRSLPVWHEAGRTRSLPVWRVSGRTSSLLAVCQAGPAPCWACVRQDQLPAGRVSGRTSSLPAGELPSVFTANNFPAELSSAASRVKFYFIRLFDPMCSPPLKLNIGS